MGGTKIMVFHLREIIRTAIFALIGIAMIILLIYLFIPRHKQDAETSLYIPGTYSSEIILHSNPVGVEITVTENEIVSVELKNMAEAQEVFYPLFKPTLNTLAKDIVQYQTADLTPRDEYPVTSRILLDAVQSAIDMAKAEE